ncbi:MAG: addiction module protein [Candidatus Methylacidiphilales bacterium]
MTTLATVERLALELPEQQRATLAVHILDSLPGLFSEKDGGLAEAERRDLEMDANPSVSMTLEDFDQQIANRRR